LTGFSSDDNHYQQSSGSPDGISKIQCDDLFYQFQNQMYIATSIRCKNYRLFMLHSFSRRAKKIGHEIKKQNCLISQLTMWNEFTLIPMKRRCIDSSGSTTAMGHKRAKKN